MSLLVTLEGSEGSGKSTQARLLREELERRGYRVQQTREPGGTRLGEKVRQILLDPDHTEMESRTEVLLFSAARAQIVEELIRPFLRSGGVVISDRYADSTLAYQGYGLQMDLKALRDVTRFATDGLTPDLTVLLDVPADEGLLRKEQEDPADWNRMEERELLFHQRVRDGYLELAHLEPARWLVLDGTQGVMQIHRRILDEVLRRISLDAANTNENMPMTGVVDS